MIWSKNYPQMAKSSLCAQVGLIKNFFLLKCVKELSRFSLESLSKTQITKSYIFILLESEEPLKKQKIKTIKKILNQSSKLSLFGPSGLLNQKVSWQQ